MKGAANGRLTGFLTTGADANKRNRPRFYRAASPTYLLPENTAVALTKETLGSGVGTIYNSPSLGITFQLRAPNSKEAAKTSFDLPTAVDTCDFDNELGQIWQNVGTCLPLLQLIRILDGLSDPFTSGAFV